MNRSGTSLSDSQPLSRKIHIYLFIYDLFIFCSTCGLAEELEQEKKSSQPKSACGNVNSHFCLCCGLQDAVCI